MEKSPFETFFSQAPCGISHKDVRGTRQIRPRKSVIPPQSDAAVASVAVTADEPENKREIFGIAPITWQKIIPLGFMFFCILFNYTILRDTKVREQPSLLFCSHHNLSVSAGYS